MLANYSPEKILKTTYETKMISSGDNYPTLKISGTNLQYLLVMLHLGIESNAIKTKLNWTSEEFEKQMHALELEGLLNKTEGSYYPTCMVITANEGEKLYNLCEPLIKPTLNIIEKYSNQIPVFTAVDLSILNEIANTISEDLILLCKENEKPLKEYFASSRYSKEITYEEFFIWWYHFFYTKITEELIKQGIISISTQENQNI
ncbi:hypothetical protein JFU18_02510 [Bacillus sp. TH22]|uniref:hypothetical protein n=1 Tax=unclassified Bacillus (in: firmicutes) TaxID=185979 RepID=UPI0019113E3B|nr:MULTISPECIES: hypothetical protein [unclassified Bacillus (in: firmicutes)]MBK5447561.1 hypothetical protein [Bacillus sp. TH22]MBK5453582.1 hypothetical protein [Bacillus sp. TH23]